MINQIFKRIEEVENLYTGELLKKEEYINRLDYDEDDNKLIIEVKPLGTDADKNRQIQRAVVRKLKIDLKISGVKIINMESKKEDEILFPHAKIIAVISGKGGVGKSEVTYGLAKALRRNGKNVGIVDADIYGYSIQKIANVYGEVEHIGEKIKPLIDENGIELISSQHFIRDNQNEAIVWRGPMLNKMMGNFFKFIDFSTKLDYLLIDMPPGTGDVLLNLPAYFEEINTVLVTTPDINASHVAERAGKVAKQLHMNNLGIIENMAYVMIGKDKHYIFGKGGADAVSETLKIPVLGEVRFVNREFETSKQLEPDYDKIVESLLEGGKHGLKK